MNLSITLLLIAATVLVSWLSFNNPRLLERLILWPPAIERKFARNCASQESR